MKIFSLKSLLYFAILFLIFIQVYPYIFDSKLFLGGDNADYYLLANALSSGEGYVNIHLPDAPPANHFPPGYSFLMSLIIRIGFETMFAMKVFNGILLLLSSYLLFHLSFKLTKNKVLSIILAALVLLNSNMLEYSTIVMSEISFVFFTLLSIYLFILCNERNFNIKSPYFYLMIVSMVILFYIRTQGIALFGAFFIYMAFKKQFKPLALFIALSLIAILPWQIRSANLGGSTYMKQLMRVEPYKNDSKKMEFGDWVDRFSANTVRYISKEIPNVIFPIMKVDYKDRTTGKDTKAPTSYWVVGMLIVVLALLGIWSMKEYRWLFLLLYGSTFGIYMLWPQVWFGIRFVLPMAPITLMFAVFGVYFILQSIFRTKTPLIESNKFALVFALLCFLQISPIKALAEKSLRPHPTNWANFLKIGEWSKDHLKGENIIISNRKPGLIYATSKHKQAGFLYSTDRGAMLDDFKKNGVTHVIFEQLGFNQTGLYLFPLFQKEPEKFKQIHQFGAALKKDQNGKNIPPTNAAWIYEFNPDLGYQGKYVNGVREGKGRYIYQDKSVLVGNWVNDTIVGDGVLTRPDGSIFTGKWEKGRKQGKFIIHDPSKNQFIESYWQNDTVNVEGYLTDDKGNRKSTIRLR
jgi:hypothetical protein